MGLYNMVFGNSKQAPLVLMLLDRTAGDFGRFRGAWVEKNDAGELRMVVYTRCGGGNREEYEHVFDEMRTHPLYLDSADDDCDCTYASFFFKVPPDADTRVAKLAEEQGVKMPDGWTIANVAQPTVDMGDRWNAVVDAIKSAPITPSKD